MCKNFRNQQFYKNIQTNFATSNHAIKVKVKVLISTRARWSPLNKAHGIPPKKKKERKEKGTTLYNFPDQEINSALIFMLNFFQCKISTTDSYHWKL